MSSFERRTTRRYLGELLGAMAFYFILVFVSKWLKPNLDAPVLLRAIVALVPMIGVGIAAWAIFRGMRRLDEMQSRMLLEVITWAFMTTAILSIAYGFLESAIALPRLSMFVVWIVMAVAWFVVGFIYRCLGKVSPWWGP